MGMILPGRRRFSLTLAAAHDMEYINVIDKSTVRSRGGGGLSPWWSV